MRENLPIEVKFSRRVVGDTDPYGFFGYVIKSPIQSCGWVTFLI